MSYLSFFRNHITSSALFQKLHLKRFISTPHARHQRQIMSNHCKTVATSTEDLLPIESSISAGSNFTFYLGSGSSSRKAILAEMNIDFRVVKADIDERSIGNRDSADGAKELVLLLAREKAMAITSMISNSDENDSLDHNGTDTLLITCDQVVTCNGKILEKPSTTEEAREFIAGYSKYACSTVGSIMISNLRSGKHVIGVDTATIRFNPIPDEIVQQLINEVINKDYMKISF